ncbi:MAG TPA: PDDEXK nuclease domain-containing protein [Alphaproteobacteria bacterium]|nr:PDDEXK nuclease domain-containing protein [Alphaproteobacteria bacterium]HQS94674.1 PDDEXK nuclease domain-containing protein [Alphaproteobacteria bacterium]
MNNLVNLDKEYASLFHQLKEKIRESRLRAAMALSQGLIELYWDIGDKILKKQQQTLWGSKLIDLLSRDLQTTFPETRGFSIRNLERMRQFAQYYPVLDFTAQAVPQLPWGHIILLLQKVKTWDEREWYARQTIEQGWSRLTLETYVKRKLYEQQAVPENKASNFLTRLPSPQSLLAQDILKNPYNFDFLGLHDDALERDIEHALTSHITKFLLELGKGFAFVGRQVPITLEDEEYFIDMLFFHLKLRAYVVVEIKATKFRPEHTGQLNFYLNLVDQNLKGPTDNASIGLLLCKSRSKIVAEYALQGIEKPIGISEYDLTKAIPDKLIGCLPSIEEIEFEMNQMSSDSQENRAIKNVNFEQK